MASASVAWLYSGVDAGSEGAVQTNSKARKAGKVDNEIKKKAKKRRQGQRRVSVTLGVRRSEVSALQG